MSVIQAIFKLANPLNALILRSPLHGLLSQRIMLAIYTGRKSGKRLQNPAAYFRERADTIRCFTETDRQWWRNIIDGQAFTARVAGKDYTARAAVVSLADDEMKRLLAESYRGMSEEQIRQMIRKPMMLRITLGESPEEKS